MENKIAKLLIDKLYPYFIQWKTKKGYFSQLILICLACFYFNLFNSVLFILIAGTVVLLWTVTWWILSGRLLARTLSKKTVVLCFDVDMEARKNYERVVSEMRVKLKDLDISKKVRIIDIGSDIITDRIKAHRYRELCNVDIVVWGKTFYGNLENQRVSKYQVHHTFSISETLKQNLEMFLADLGIILLRRKWLISELNELVDVSVVSDNFFETCLLIIGIYYYDERNFLDSIKIFEAILLTLNMKQKADQSPEYVLQISRISALLTGLYYIQASIEHEAGNHRVAINFLSKIPQHVPNKIFIFMMLARAYYLLGDFHNAQKYTNEIKSINKKHPAVPINHAFFGIIQKNYDRTRFWYDQLLKLNNFTDVDIFSVITFLDEEYRKNPSEHAFLYALGIVNGFVDPITRKNNLQRFLRLTKNRTEYGVLRKRSQELLSKQN